MHLIDTKSTNYFEYYQKVKSLLNKLHLIYAGFMLSWIFMAHWNNSPRVDMSLHSDTLFWYRAIHGKTSGFEYYQKVKRLLNKLHLIYAGFLLLDSRCILDVFSHLEWFLSISTPPWYLHNDCVTRILMFIFKKLNVVHQ
jgi:hypothetical protein